MSLEYVEDKLVRWAAYHMDMAAGLGFPAETLFYRMLKQGGHVRSENRPESGGTTQREAERHERYLTTYKYISLLPDIWQATVAARYLHRPALTMEQIGRVLNISKSQADRRIKDIHIVLSIYMRRPKTKREMEEALEFHRQKAEKA